jgi:hypothetical protein
LTVRLIATSLAALKTCRPDEFVFNVIERNVEGFDFLPVIEVSSGENEKIVGLLSAKAINSKDQKVDKVGSIFRPLSEGVGSQKLPGRLGQSIAASCFRGNRESQRFCRTCERLCKLSGASYPSVRRSQMPSRLKSRYCQKHQVIQAHLSKRSPRQLCIRST